MRGLTAPSWQNRINKKKITFHIEVMILILFHFHLSALSVKKLNRINRINRIVEGLGKIVLIH
jgi:hypothetical protein